MVMVMVMRRRRGDGGGGLISRAVNGTGHRHRCAERHVRMDETQFGECYVDAVRTILFGDFIDLRFGRQIIFAMFIFLIVRIVNSLVLDFKIVRLMDFGVVFVGNGRRCTDDGGGGSGCGCCG